MDKFKSLLKEIIIGGSILFILSNIISYIRKPTLDNQQIPTETFTLLDGSKYHIEEGKPLLIHFWATWCKVCSVEAANIVRVSKHYNVLSIAVQSGNIAQIQAHMQKEDIHFNVVADPEGILAQQFKVSAYPSDFIYDAKGKLFSTDVGYTSTAGLLARMKLAE